MYAYKRVYGVDVEVAAVAARGDHVIEFAKKHRIPTTYRDFRAVLADKTIDVVDICTPPAMHAMMIVEAVQAGKHVICEKPFTGYFGRPGRNGQDLCGREIERAALHVRGRLGLRAGGDENRRNPDRDQGQDPVHEG
jgi:hypothetical protein